MRNSVKATVDAYDGTVTLYEWDDQDPILKAWGEVFPGLLKAASEIPDELLSHLRYPEDLFKVQRYQFQRYHETVGQGLVRGLDPLGGAEGPDSRRPPAAAAVPLLHRRGRQAWSLTSVYVPRGRANLVAYMCVNSDATDEDNYGKISVRELPNERTDGPVQIANELSSDETCARSCCSFTKVASTPVPGNLLTLPIGDGLMYVQPLYTQRRTASRRSRSCASCWCRTATRSASVTRCAGRSRTSSASRRTTDAEPPSDRAPGRPGSAAATRRPAGQHRLGQRPDPRRCCARRRPSSPRPTTGRRRTATRWGGRG